MHVSIWATWSVPIYALEVSEPLNYPLFLYLCRQSTDPPQQRFSGLWGGFGGIPKHLILSVGGQNDDFGSKMVFLTILAKMAILAILVILTYWGVGYRLWDQGISPFDQNDRFGRFWHFWPKVAFWSFWWNGCFIYAFCAFVSFDLGITVHKVSNWRFCAFYPTFPRGITKWPILSILRVFCQNVYMHLLSITVLTDSDRQPG